VEQHNAAVLRAAWAAVVNAARGEDGFTFSFALRRA
jgi:hypothetical protein